MLFLKLGHKLEKAMKKLEEMQCTAGYIAEMQKKKTLGLNSREEKGWEGMQWSVTIKNWL